jgi:N-acetylglutamate synthase-like GNAT family acetyltransferase
MIDSCQIIEYKDQHHEVFKALNTEWLERYNLLEPHDLEILNDPRSTILETGGAIFLASDRNQIIGTAALMKEHEGVFELVKMTVAPDYRGKGISKLLIEKCLEKAMELKAKKITLFSNHQLQAALALYKKYGFQHVPVVDSPFATADVKMELVF